MTDNANVELKFTYLRVFMTVAQAMNNGGAGSLPLTFGYHTRAAAEEAADALAELRRQVLTAAPDAPPVFPDLRIKDHFGNDYVLDVRAVGSFGVVDPAGSGSLGSQLQITQILATMHHEKRIKDNPQLSEWIRRQQTGSRLVAPGGPLQ